MDNRAASRGKRRQYAIRAGTVIIGQGEQAGENIAVAIADYHRRVVARIQAVPALKHNVGRGGVEIRHDFHRLIHHLRSFLVALALDLALHTGGEEIAEVRPQDTAESQVAPSARAADRPRGETERGPAPHPGQLTDQAFMAGGRRNLLGSGFILAIEKNYRQLGLSEKFSPESLEAQFEVHVHKCLLQLYLVVRQVDIMS